MSLKSDQLNEVSGLGSNISGVVDIPLDRLKPLPGHPHVLNKSDVKRAKPFVERFKGRVFPVLVDDDDRVISNYIMVQASQALGHKSMRVIRQSGLSSTEGLLTGVALSKIQMSGSWDGNAMEIALREFESVIDDFSSTLIGFAPGELDRLIGANVVAPEADVSPPLQTKAVNQLGMMWQCGHHIVCCGDATDLATMEILLKGEKVTVCLSDPPFGCKIEGFVSKSGRHREFVQASGEMDETDLAQFFTGFCKAVASVMEPGGLIYLVIDWRSLGLLQRAAETVFGRLVNLCVWAKDRAGMGSFYRSQHELILVFAMPGAQHRNHIELGRHGRDRSNVWSYPSAASSRKGRESDMLRNHPTPKPVEMIVDAIIDSSERGDIVLDCFLGSGTTLIASERSSRKCRGIDLDPLYVDLAVRRWQVWTGLDAVDVNSGRTFNDIAAEADHV